MSTITLSNPAKNVIPARGEIEEKIGTMITNFRLADKGTKPFNVTYFVKKIDPDIKNSAEISNERLRLKILETFLLRVANKYQDSREKLNILVVLNTPEVDEAFFSQLTRIGKTLGFPDLTEDVKERIVFGVQNLTKSQVEDVSRKENVWAKIVTKEQFKQMKQVKLSKSAIVVKA